MKSETNIDLTSFKEKLAKIDNTLIEQTIAKARAQGISEKDIQDGLRFLGLFRDGRAD